MCAEKHLIGLQTADAGRHGGYFQTSFITSFRHQLQNGVGKIDGRRGLVNMRDWNDTQSGAACCRGGGGGGGGTRAEKTLARIHRININSNEAAIDAQAFL